MISDKQKATINIVIVSIISIGMIIGLSIPLGILPAIGNLFLPGNGIWNIEEDVTSEEVLSIPELNSDVTIYRDQWGIPHIYGINEEDLAFALGYVHAQDRLLQMDLARRLTNGRLAEILGQSMIEQDKFNLNMMKKYWVEETYDQMKSSTDPIIIKILNTIEAYSDGINYYIQNANTLPAEFLLLDFSPEEWTVVDTLGFIKYMSEMLTWDYSDFTRLMLKNSLNGNYTELFDYPIPYQIPICPEYGNYSNSGLVDEDQIIKNNNLESSFKIENELLNSVENLLQDIFTLPSEQQRLNFESLIGSNNWVISGNKTATGKPLLCNDMHLGHTLPGIWYEAHIINTSPDADFNVYGFFLAGVPYPIVGHNSYVAWGMTNTGYDVIDWYYYDAVNETHYIYDGNPIAYETINYTIQIKGASPIIHTIKQTVHGPVFYDLIDEGEIGQLDNKIIACKWIAQSVTNEALAIHGFSNAKNRDDFNDASRNFATPSQNIVYADIHGNIGIRPTGKVPIRNDTGIPVWHTGNGSMPYDGSNGEGEWIDYVPFDDLPHSENPAQGYLASANQIIAGPEYFDNYYLQNLLYVSQGYRARRINDVLSCKDNFTIEDMKTLQLDFYSKKAEQFIPFLLDALSSKGSLTITETKIIEMLENWDYYLEKDSAEATIFVSWMKKYHTETFEDEMNNVSAPRLPKETVLEFLTKNEPNSHWFDNIATEGTETRDDIILLALEKAINALEEYYQDNSPENWLYGDIHFVAFPNLAGISSFSKGPYSSGGSSDTVNPIGISGLWRDDKLNRAIGTSGASERMIIDFSDMNNSLSIIPSGERGISNSIHYADQLNLYLEGKYHVQYFGADTLEEFKEYWIESRIIMIAGGEQ